MLFARANDQEARVLVDILQKYEGLSGQQINFDKSELFFNKGLKGGHKAAVQAVLGITGVEWHGKYLGLPTLIGKSKKVLFASIKDRVWEKL